MIPKIDHGITKKEKCNTMYFMKIGAKFWNKILANCIKSYMKVRNRQTFSLKAVLANNIDFVSHKVSVAVIELCKTATDNMSMIVSVLITQLCPTLCSPMDCTRFPCPWNSPGKNTGVDYHSLFQGIFVTQRSNPGLLHCR